VSAAEAEVLDPGVNFVRWQAGYCQRCRRAPARGRLMLIHVRPIAASPPHSPRRQVHLRAECADPGECKAFRDAEQTRRELRSGPLEWRCSRFRAAGRGNCHWCGEPIVIADPDDYRRRARAYHRGDEHEAGDRNCQSEQYGSYTTDPRRLIQLRGDPCCVDCGDTGERFVANEGGEGGYWYQTGEWEADHDVPLWAGGEHSVTNIVRRCVDCHKKKTQREARERAERRRGPSPQGVLV
jgi:5-methylcytosine-specific restriction endonuclease McrA